MNAEIKYPKTLIEAVTYFSNLDNAHNCFVQMRWPKGPVCPECGSTDIRYLAKYRRFQCSHKHDRRQFTVKTGSVMEDSPIGLDKWAVAFWLEVNAKNSISSYEIHRALGITQKTAWFMLHRIRLAVKSSTLEKIGGNGPVEADETFIGGLAKNMHSARRRKVITGTGGSNKTAVMGLLERHTEKGKSQVRVSIIPNTQRDTLHDVIRTHVEPGSHIYTDAWQAYRQLGPEYFHQFVDHAEAYVKGIVHTNGLENFWSLFKRCIKGTHVSVEPFHLQAYLDSEAFRFDNRELTDGGRFVKSLQNFAGKRLTYKQLIGQSEVPPAGGGENESLPN